MGEGASCIMSSSSRSSSRSSSCSTSLDIISGAFWKLGRALADVFFAAPVCARFPAAEACVGAFIGRGGLNCGPLRRVVFAAALFGGIAKWCRISRGSVWWALVWCLQPAKRAFRKSRSHLTTLRHDVHFFGFKTYRPESTSSCSRACTRYVTGLVECKVTLFTLTILEPSHLDLSFLLKCIRPLRAFTRIWLL